MRALERPCAPQEVGEGLLPSLLPPPSLFAPWGLMPPAADLHIPPRSTREKFAQVSDSHRTRAWCASAGSLILHLHTPCRQMPLFQPQSGTPPKKHAPTPPETANTPSHTHNQRTQPVDRGSSCSQRASTSWGPPTPPPKELIRTSSTHTTRQGAQRRRGTPPAVVSPLVNTSQPASQRDARSPPIIPPTRHMLHSRQPLPSPHITHTHTQATPCSPPRAGQNVF